MKFTRTMCHFISREEYKQNISDDQLNMLYWPVHEKTLNSAVNRVKPLLLRFSRGCKPDGRQSILPPSLNEIELKESEGWQGFELCRPERSALERSYIRDFSTIQSNAVKILRRNLPPTATLWLIIHDLGCYDRLSIDELRAIVGGAEMDLESARESLEYDGFATFLQFMAGHWAIDCFIDEEDRELICFVLVEAGASTGALRRPPCADGDFEACEAMVARAARRLGVAPPAGF